MELSYFTYITGGASLVGLSLQIFDVFPNYAAYRKYISLFIAGIFVGTLLNTFNASHINFDIRISGFTLLITVFVITILGFLITGAKTKEPRKREELFGIGGVVFLRSQATINLL